MTPALASNRLRWCTGCGGDGDECNRAIFAVGNYAEDLTRHHCPSPPSDSEVAIAPVNLNKAIAFSAGPPPSVRQEVTMGVCVCMTV